MRPNSPTGLRLAIAVSTVLLAGCTANDDVHAPSLANVNPPRASLGFSIVLTGNYFCQQPESHGEDDVDPNACENVGSVLFGSAASAASQYTETSITVDVPDLPAGVLAVRVSVRGRTSNSVDLTIE